MYHRPISSSHTVIVLSQPPKGWDHRQEPPCPGSLVLPISLQPCPGRGPRPSVPGPSSLGLHHPSLVTPQDFLLSREPSSLPTPHPASSPHFCLAEISPVPLRTVPDLGYKNQGGPILFWPSAWDSALACAVSWSGGEGGSFNIPRACQLGRTDRLWDSSSS